MALVALGNTHTRQPAILDCVETRPNGRQSAYIDWSPLRFVMDESEVDRLIVVLQAAKSEFAAQAPADTGDAS